MTAPVSLSACRVLVVENDYWSAREIEIWLRQAGSKVLGPVSSVSAALQLIASNNPPDLSILNPRLFNGERSYPVAERLRELDLPYLFVTGRDDLTYHAACQDRPVLLKPFGHYELFSALKKLLPQAITTLTEVIAS